MLKVSRVLTSSLRNIDKGTLKALTEFLHSIEYSKSVPMDQIQDILVKGGYTLLQEDNTPWAGIISCPTEQNVRFSIPIGKLGGSPTESTSDWLVGGNGAVRENENKYPDANTQYTETGAFLAMQLYRMPSGTIEITGYLT